MMTTTSYPTGAPSSPSRQQQNIVDYGYGYGYGKGNNVTYQTASTGHGGPTQNAYNSYPPAQSNTNTYPYPPQQQPPAFAQSHLQPQSQSQPHHSSSYGAMPNPPATTYPQSQPAETPVPSRTAVTEYTYVAPEDATGVGRKKKTKTLWSLYGRSKNEAIAGAEDASVDPVSSTAAVVTDPREIASRSNNNNNNSSNNDNTPPRQKRRWSLNFRKSEAKEETENTPDDRAPNAAAITTNQLEIYSNNHKNSASSPPKPSQENGNMTAKEANGSMPAELHPEKEIMKQDRKAKIAGAATTGAIVGAILTGPVWPVGAMAGAAIGSYASKVTARAGERRQQRKWEQKTFNAYTAKGEAGVQSESVSFA